MFRCGLQHLPIRETCHSGQQEIAADGASLWMDAILGQSLHMQSWRSFGRFVEERAECRYRKCWKGITADPIVGKRNRWTDYKDSHRAVLKPAAWYSFWHNGCWNCRCCCLYWRKSKNFLTKNKNLISYKSWEKQKWELLALDASCLSHGSSFSNEIWSE